MHNFDIKQVLELLRSAGVEVINAHLINLHAHNVVYCGYETSGTVHWGSMLTYLIVKAIGKCNNCSSIILNADVHAILNHKVIHESISEQFKRIDKSSQHIQFIDGSSFQFKQQYIKDFLTLSSTIKISHVKKALLKYNSLLSPSSVEEIKSKNNIETVSDYIYPLFQILDIVHLNVNIAVGRNRSKKDTYVT